MARAVPRAAVRTSLRIAVSAAVLAVLAWRFGARDIAAQCLAARPGPFLGALAIYLASQLVSALRWQRLARGVGFRVGWSTCARMYLVGMFFGLAIPSTLGADATRAVMLGRQPPGKALAVSCVLFDRLIGLVALAAVAVGALVVGPTASLPSAVTLAIAASGSALVAGWFATPLLVARLPESVPGRARLQRLFTLDLAPYFRDRALLALATALSLAVHLLQIASQFVLARALGLHPAFGFVAIYHPLVALAAAIPVTIGGFGLREATYALILPRAGVPANEAVALGILWWAVGAGGGLIGGALYAASPADRPVRGVDEGA
ncbi:MAG TPA: lysylphosphatidylglycerol synthase transmembrane domain-containing protein [Candidatus Binatia bacterium]|nr:lysylphosphatidylglycerol synthase transmembrane domain-containing protein [Candidatus Binatia bacterium]